ncbi:MULTISPECIES: ATP-binding cassette domain-containing protein [unclassified Caballeronia]|uniref:ABC transporter ATP-binding protein n=1 Tax=unclassified Caballeronia TaxID=2646786 RepID=UPI0028584D2F|nr:MULTISPECIES: ATP-binding cassette domain-containing protein [unclassified Caballeronia]MDR5750507.1 ATP-binding cassette domain-containing protein [Caballeronia sp. LZ024]MDR5842460.1 ATP-binding cassette domain-containing protein [Caballeronia sp. LZ031]
MPNPQQAFDALPETPSRDARAALIAACGVERRDPVRRAILLHPTDFVLREGDRAVITGPSGSGKSVFLRTLALLDPLDAGQILWRGEPIARARVPAYRRRVAYIAQRPAMLDGSVEDNLRYPFGLKVYRDLHFDRAAVARLAAAASRSDDFLDKRASELSGGEAQIAALIRVLQLAPDVLLLDEPTASLDPDSAREIEALVAAWSAEAPARASIWISHDPAQARRVGDRQLTMVAGTLAEALSHEGTP